MPPAYLALAIDHGSSFDTYLQKAGSSMERGAAKQRLAQLLGGSVDALVIDSRRQPIWGVNWPEQMWWGAPDQHVRADTPHGQVAAALALDDIDFDWFTGVKIGVVAAGADAWRRACSEMSILAEIAAPFDLRMVFEPYFADSDDISLREDVLARVTQLPQVEFAKLDVYSSHLLAAYTKASGVPWLARSDGRSYDEHVPALQEAVADGCGGSMIGAALWGDTLAAIDEHAELLLERTAELRKVLALQPGDGVRSSRRPGVGVGK